MIIEAGKAYKLRNGDMAVVSEELAFQSPPGEIQFIGRRNNHSGYWFPCGWTASGFHYESLHFLDIMEEWKDEPEGVIPGREHAGKLFRFPKGRLLASSIGRPPYRVLKPPMKWRDGLEEAFTVFWTDGRKAFTFVKGDRIILEDES